MEEDKEKVYATFFVKKNITQEDCNKDSKKMAIDQLAQVVSFLENRLERLEKLLSHEVKGRGIRIVYKDE